MKRSAPDALERSGSDENAPATSSAWPSIRAATRCTAPMNAPRPRRSSQNEASERSSIGVVILPGECGIERDPARGEIEAPHEGGGLGGAVHPIHPDVLPFHRQRTTITDVVERHDHVFKPDVAVAERAEVPLAPWVAEARVTAEDPHAAVAVPPPRVLHVHVEDTAAECADELHVVHALIAEMRRIEVEPET